MSLPVWYPFKKISGQVNDLVLEELGKKRIDLLIDQTRKMGNLDNNEILQDEFASTVSFLSLLITASLTDDPIFRNWILESEGDLLAFLLKKSKKMEKIAVLKDIYEEIYFGWHNVYKLTHLSKDEIIRELSYLLSDVKKYSKFVIELTRSDDKIAILKFWRAPRVLMKRQGIIRFGWLITPTEVLLHDVKWSFQKKMERKIADKSLKMKYQELKPLADSLLQYWKGKRNIVAIKKDIGDKKIIGSKLYEREDLWPPCMRILISKLRATGYVAHVERLQLGLFLKKLGMPVDEQLKFWYKFAVDNVGMSWEEFERKGGYYIKHIYGLVGGKKDYEAPKCDTIIAKYFCAMRHVSIDELKKLLKEIYNPPQSVLKEILNLARDRKAKTACSVLLSYLSDRKIEKDIQHPIQFVRILYYAKKGDRSKKTSSNVNKNKGGRDRPVDSKK